MAEALDVRPPAAPTDASPAIINPRSCIVDPFAKRPGAVMVAPGQSGSRRGTTPEGTGTGEDVPGEQRHNPESA